LAVGDILVIGGADYRIAAGGIVGDIPPSHTNGSGPNTVAGVTTNETEITITLESNPDPLDGTPPAAPSFVVNALVGVQVGERASFTVDVTGTVAATFSQGTATLTTTATSTAVPASTANVTTITTFLDNFIQITKVVTNTTSGAGPAANVPGVTGDILEYTITMTNTSAADAVNVVLTDDEPPYTSYVGSSTTLNAGAVADGGVDPLPTATANGGLAVNDAGSAPGTIAAGTTATVTFQVQIQ
jgi:uncharacterized repeat protein (TIGR01451 family)